MSSEERCRDLGDWVLLHGASLAGVAAEVRALHAELEERHRGGDGDALDDEYVAGGLAHLDALLETLAGVLSAAVRGGAGPVWPPG